MTTLSKSEAQEALKQGYTITHIEFPHGIAMYKGIIEIAFDSHIDERDFWLRFNGEVFNDGWSILNPQTEDSTKYEIAIVELEERPSLVHQHRDNKMLIESTVETAENEFYKTKPVSINLVALQPITEKEMHELASKGEFLIYDPDCSKLFFILQMGPVTYAMHKNCRLVYKSTIKNDRNRQYEEIQRSFVISYLNRYNEHRVNGEFIDEVTISNANGFKTIEFGISGQAKFVDMPDDERVLRQKLQEYYDSNDPTLAFKVKDMMFEFSTSEAAREYWFNKFKKEHVK